MSLPAAPPNFGISFLFAKIDEVVSCLAEASFVGFSFNKLKLNLEQTQLADFNFWEIKLFFVKIRKNAISKRFLHGNTELI